MTYALGGVSAYYGVVGLCIPAVRRYELHMWNPVSHLQHRT